MTMETQGRNSENRSKAEGQEEREIKQGRGEEEDRKRGDLYRLEQGM
jgi:hypothetical protein